MLLLFPNFSQRRMSQSYVFSFSTSRFWFLLRFHTTCAWLKWLTNATKQHQLFNNSPLQVGEEKLKEGKRLSLYYWQERIIIDEDFKKSVLPGVVTLWYTTSVSVAKFCMLLDNAVCIHTLRAILVPSFVSFHVHDICLHLSERLYNNVAVKTTNKNMHR